MSRFGERAEAPSADYDYEDFFENGVVALHLVDGDGKIVRANKAELSMLGYNEQEYCGRSIADFHVDAPVIDDILRLLAAGERIDKYPARLWAKDGSIKHVLISSSARFEGGAFVHSRCFSVDVTQQIAAEARVRATEARCQDLLNALPTAVYTTDLDGRITYFNEAAATLAGRRPDLGVDRWCVTWRLHRTDGQPLPHDQCPMATALRSGIELRGTEAIAERPDGSRLTFMPHPTLLRDIDGQVTGAVNVLVDVSELKDAEQQQAVLINELNHRVKNTLATVQSLSLHTYRSTPDAFVPNFEGRLLALSKAHDLLTRRDWAGVTMDELLEQGLAAYGVGDSVQLLGPTLDLSPRTALALGMVIHELATNATKYGALAKGRGKVELAWRVDHMGGAPRISLSWVEMGGPPVVRSKRRGFGGALIDRTVTTELSGDVDWDFAPEGLRFAATFPLLNQ